MSEKCTNDQTNDAIKRNKSVGDSESNTLVDDGHQRKRMCRASYMHNSEDVIVSATDTFICKYSSVEYQCSSSTSSTNHCVLKPVNDDEMLDIIPLEKTMYTSDKKGKNVVSLFNNVENRIQKIVDADNCCLMKKGQAFFQKNRNGCDKFFLLNLEPAHMLPLQIIDKTVTLSLEFGSVSKSFVHIPLSRYSTDYISLHKATMVQTTDSCVLPCNTPPPLSEKRKDLGSLSMSPSQSMTMVSSSVAAGDAIQLNPTTLNPVVSISPRNPAVLIVARK